MWEIYGQSKEAIAIKTTVGNLVNSLDISKYKRNFIEFTLAKVDYTPSEQITGKLSYSAPFFIKRPHFRYESEVRLFLSSYSGCEPTMDTPIGYSIPIDLAEAISEVFVHPDSQEWFLQSVQDLIKAFGFRKSVKKGECGNTV